MRVYRGIEHVKNLQLYLKDQGWGIFFQTTNRRFFQNVFFWTICVPSIPIWPQNGGKSNPFTASPSSPMSHLGVSQPYEGGSTVRTILFRKSNTRNESLTKKGGPCFFESGLRYFPLPFYLKSNFLMD